MKQSDLEVRHSFRQKLFSITAVILFTLAPAVSSAAYGQSASPAHYGSTQNGVTVADMFSPTLSGQLKTANVGSILAARLQALGVTLNTGVASDSITIELFQATKNANHFNFFAEPLSATHHNVQVWAEGSVDCGDNNGAVIACSSGTLAGYATSTKVGIGKASLVLQEENNTSLK
jgi:hypothetical protein